MPVNDYPEINFSMIANPLTPNKHPAFRSYFPAVTTPTLRPTFLSVLPRLHLPRPLACLIRSRPASTATYMSRLP